MSYILRKSGRTSIFHEEQQSSPGMLKFYAGVLGPRQLMYRSGSDGFVCVSVAVLKKDLSISRSLTGQQRVIL